MERFIPVENFRKKGNTFRGKVPLNSLETALTSLETRLFSFKSFLASAVQLPVVRSRHDHCLILFTCIYSD